MKHKIGRNDPCPCESGKKFKHCHGFIMTDRVPDFFTPERLKLIDNERKKHEAEEYQRKIQQGLGKPIISVTNNGFRFVAVKNRLMYSKSWKTFHDFLLAYLVEVLGRDWFAAEEAKPPEQRHTLASWRRLAFNEMNKKPREENLIASASFTGAIAGCIGLAYYLYLIDHNQGLQKILIKRIKNKDKSAFIGALAEIHVVAIFFKAGYEVKFEDETDGSTTHCEFSAHNGVGRKFSVEVKAREPLKDNYHIYNQLRQALRKRADHTRIVFVEMNVENDRVDDKLPWVSDVNGRWNEMEENLTLPGGVSPPSAYVFLLNNPYEYYLEDSRYSSSAMLKGFKVDSFDRKVEITSVDDWLAIKKAHQDIVELFKTYEKYNRIPSTFDGSNPHIAGDQNFGPYIIGDTYRVPSADGSMIEAELMDAIVVKDEVWLTFKNPSAGVGVRKRKLSPEELIAYHEHPDTFFGVLKKNHGALKGIDELYDFFFETYQRSSRDQLVRQLSRFRNSSSITNLSKGQLVEILSAEMAMRAHHASK